jgi:hypothetical protein
MTDQQTHRARPRCTMWYVEAILCNVHCFVMQSTFSANWSRPTSVIGGSILNRRVIIRIDGSTSGLGEKEWNFQAVDRKTEMMERCFMVRRVRRSSENLVHVSPGTGLIRECDSSQQITTWGPPRGGSLGSRSLIISCATSAIVTTAAHFQELLALYFKRLLTGKLLQRTIICTRELRIIPPF